jgi:hypothetical protein
MTTAFGSLSAEVKKMLAQAMIVPNITSGNTPLEIYSAAHGGFWIDPAGERLPLRGGAWNAGASAGLASLDLVGRRSDVHYAIGCRPAFIL